MRKRRTQKTGRTRRAPRLSAGPLWVVAAALAVVVLLVVRELGESGRGAELVAKILGTRDLSEEALALDRAVDSALVKLGAFDLKAETETRAAGRTRWPHWTKTGRIPAGADLIQCNLAITEAVRSGGR